MQQFNQDAVRLLNEGRDFRRPRREFVAPGSTVPPVDAPPLLPEAAPAASGAVFNPYVAGAVIAGAGLGLWVVKTSKRRSPKLRPYREYSGNPRSWWEGQGRPGPGGAPQLFPPSGWYHRGYEYRDCGVPLGKWGDSSGFTGHGGTNWPNLFSAASFKHGTGLPCGTNFASSAAYYALSPRDVVRDGQAILDATFGYHVQTYYGEGPDVRHATQTKVGGGYSIYFDHPLTDPDTWEGWWVEGTPGTPVPGTGTTIQPRWFPSEEPEYAPIQQPGVPTPRRMPRASTGTPGSVPSPEVPVLNPVELPPAPIVVVQPPPGVDPSPDPQPGPGPGPVPEPGPGPVPGPVPGQVILPDQVLDLDPGSGRMRGRYSRPPAGSDSEGPPREREKERKVNVRSKFGAAWTFLNFVTEADELVVDIWRALPKSMRSKVYKNGKRVKANPADMLKDLYRHWQHIDLASALVYVFNDQLADRFYAIPGRLNTRATREIYRRYGWGNFTNVGVRSRWLPRVPGSVPPVPQVSWNPNTHRYEAGDFLADFGQFIGGV